MRHHIILFALACTPTLAVAQHGGAGQAPALNTVAPREATQWDFLLGQWELDVRPVVNTLAARIHGGPKMLGTWKAWRGLDGWGIEDELRISDNSGNPRAFAHAVRVYDAPAKQWNNVVLDVYRGTFTNSTAQWAQNEMRTSSRGVDGEGKAYLSRTRFHEITPTSFRYLQERSTDDGKTWAETLRIQAKRVSATAPR